MNLKPFPKVLWLNGKNNKKKASQKYGIKISTNFALLALIKDALGRTWPHFLLKYVFISASKAKLADIFMPLFCDEYP